MQYIKGRTAVITGISKGIGRSLTQGLLGAGAHVVGWGRTAPDYTHERLHFIPCDIRDEAAVSAALAQTLALHPKLDFLINNGGFGYFAPIGAFDSEQFRQMFEVNVFGTFYCSKAIAPLMQAQGSGHILNVGSIAGKTGMAQGEGYNASKFAVTGFTQALFADVRPSGVKVTAVYPGSTATNFFDAIPGFAAHPMMMDPDEVALAMLRVMDTSPNFVINEIEMRPLRSK
jgi:NAD(P)-dependent dehydrogenase (short-subunit alcohol dehydrogenase family)